MSDVVLHRIAKLLELTALASGHAGSNLSNAERLGRQQQLRDELWPKGLRSEHQRNPMNHMSRLRQSDVP